MKEEILNLVLHYNIKDLIEIQKRYIEEEKKETNDELTINFLKDILFILKLFSSVDSLELNEKQHKFKLNVINKLIIEK